MKRILFVYLLMFILPSAIAAPNDFQSSVREISVELAAINQQLIESYQVQQDVGSPELVSNGIQAQQYDADTLQIKIPLGTIQDWSGISKIKVNNKIKNPKKNLQSQDEDVYEIIINKMRDLKRKYDKNPYIRIAGFDINIGIIPSVTVSIEFKK